MSKETALIREMLLAASAQDVRLWRNETGVYWTGELVGFTDSGAAILARPSRVSAGLCVGSSDIIGIGPAGRFVAAEVKTEGVVTTPAQTRFIEVVNDLGGLAGVVRNVDELLALVRRGG